MKLTKMYKVRVYEHGDFIVEIVSRKDYHEAWLRHKDYGVSTCSYGTVTTLGEFLELVLATLDEDIEAYKKEVMDDEV